MNSGGIYVSGYQNRSNITAQPFKAENIVVVYDGYCASTCTIFSEFMRQQANVSTIALGGRPTRDIIQAVGGVKGTNSYPWDYILGSVELPYQLEEVHDAAYYSNETALGDYSNLPLLRATNYVVNARDGIRDGDEEQTPLHFVYEPADCRIYYTPEMVVDVDSRHGAHRDGVRVGEALSQDTRHSWRAPDYPRCGARSTMRTRIVRCPGHPRNGPGAPISAR